MRPQSCLIKSESMKYTALLLVSLIAIATIALSDAAHAVETRFYNTLATEFRGGDMRLAGYKGGSMNNQTRLVPAADATGQYWRFTPAGNGYWRLSTMFHGPGMCLDVVNGGARNNQLQLVPCGNYSGQLWRLQQVGEAYRLSTAFRGPGMCLDIFNGGADNNKPHLTQCGNYSGQLWYINPSWKPVK